MSISLRVNGLDQAKQLLNRLHQEVDARNQKLLGSMGATAETQVRRRISDEKTAPDGTPWPQLDPKSAERKKKPRKNKNRSSGGILEDQGDLIDSIEYQMRSDSEVMVGTSLIYAATHDQGSEKRGIPQRQFLGLSEENLEEITDALQQQIRDWF